MFTPVCLSKKYEIYIPVYSSIIFSQLLSIYPYKYWSTSLLASSPIYLFTYRVEGSCQREWARGCRVKGEGVPFRVEVTAGINLSFEGTVYSTPDINVGIDKRDKYVHAYREVWFVCLIVCLYLIASSVWMCSLFKYVHAYRGVWFVYLIVCLYLITSCKCEFVPYLFNVRPRVCVCVFVPKRLCMHVCICTLLSKRWLMTHYVPEFVLLELTFIITACTSLCARVSVYV